MQNYPQNQSPSGSQWSAPPPTQSQVPPPPPMQAMPPRPPVPKKKTPWLWIIACVVCLGLGYGVGRAGATDISTTTPPTTQATQPGSAATTAPTTAAQPTAKPTQAPKWTVTHSYKGSGSKKTETIAVPSDWKIAWTCSGVPASLTDAPLFITVYNSDGTMADSVQYNCKAGAKNGDSTQEHQGGNVYLDINTGIDWTIDVQEMK